MTYRLAVFFFLLLSFPLSGIQAQPPAGLLAGVAEADITPTELVPLWRYEGEPTPMPLATGTADPLKVKALVLAHGAHRVAILSLDLGRPPEEKLFDRLAGNTGIDHLMLVATHTERGPVVDALLPPAPTDPANQALKRYYSYLEGVISDTINKAQLDLVPVQIGWRRITLEGIEQPEDSHGRRPADDNCMVVKLVRADQSTLASWVNFACHANTRPDDDLNYSADFPGVLTAKVEAATGAPCLFLQGAAYRQYAAPPKDSVSPANITAAVGHEFAQQIIPVVEALTCPEVPDASLRFVASFIALPSKPNLGNPEVMLGFSDVMGVERSASYILRYGGNRIVPTVTACLINDKLLLTGVSGELSSEAARSIRQQLNVFNVCVFGYCNGYDHVFPGVLDVLPSEGGRPIHRAWVGNDSAEKLVRHLRKDLVPRLFGTLPTAEEDIIDTP